MANDKFAADVAGWAKKTVLRQTEVLHQSIRLLDQTVVEKTPVVTGNLRNSRAVSTSPVAVDWSTKKFRNPDDTINNAIAGIDVGETAYLGFRAPYAHKIEAKEGFMRLAAQRWPMIVNDAVKAKT